MADRIKSKRDPNLHAPVTGKFVKGHKFIGKARVKGKPNLLFREIRRGLLDAAIAYGCDGRGTDGLAGFYRLAIEKHFKQFIYLFARGLVPTQGNLDVDIGVSGGISVKVAHVAAVASGSFLLPDGRIVSETEAAHAMRHHMPPPLPPHVVIDNTLDDDADGDAGFSDPPLPH